MPQKHSRRMVQVLSNNNNGLLSGTVANRNLAVSALVTNSCVHGANTSNSVNIPFYSPNISSPNERIHGNPMTTTAVAVATSLNSATASHHQQPPLITDTLTACLDVNGTYICTSYSPRCYIIQKVTPNTVTVTPHVIPGDSPSASGILPGVNSTVTGSVLPSTSTSSCLSISRKLGKPGRGGISSSPTASHRPHPLAHLNSYQPPPASHATHHCQHQHKSPVLPQSQTSVHGAGTHHNLQYLPQRHSKAPYQTPSTPSIGGDRQPVTVPFSNSTKSVWNHHGNLIIAATSTTATTGRSFMSGEVGPATTTLFSGEESTPAMVLQSSSSASAGPQFSDNRTANGLKDGMGMSREQMKSVESFEVDSADISRRHDPGSGANATSSDIPKEELKRLLLQQLEYYFSPENLANDKFLVSQMDSDHYVYISTLANFNMVKKLTGDIDLVTEVLRDSKNVQVHSDGKRVRPVSHRTVVILRGIPEGTPGEEIKALFNSENCPKCNSCEFAFNDSWYVSFESDEDAQRAHRYLREDVKEFKGQPIMARIKSRPTTLLAQGAGVHLKNGFHQPTQLMSPYIPPAYVPGSQTGPTTSVAPSPMYTHGQTVPSVYPIPPNYSYGPWPIFGMGHEQISQIYPLNGLPPQHQQSSTYPKGVTMNHRPRNPNQIRPRRPPPPSSDNQGINGIGNTSSVSSHQSYVNAPRKSSNPPPPLLNMVSNHSALPLVNPTTHNQSQGHMLHTSVQVSGNAISQNGSRHYANSLPSSHSSLDPYHSSGSGRNFRNTSDSRPRSSLSNKKGPPRREEESNYEGPSASPSLSAKVPSTRGAPSTNVPVSQPPTETVSHPPQGKINFDLEGSAFPPLPGTGLPSGKNGDAVFEGRLSDVVKGVKNIKVAGSYDKDDHKSSVSTANLSTEIIVSAEESDGPGEVREVSAASPIADLEVEKKPGHMSSQISTQSGRKEFREVGVGSADDSHDIRSSQCKSSSVARSARTKETADKSTRTDEALLNGDQSQGLKHGSTSTSTSSQTLTLSQNNGGRKSVVSQSTTTSKSPTPGKRAVPAFSSQVQNASSSVSVGPEVPYSSRNVTSPVTTPAKPSTSQLASGSGGGNAGLNTSISATGRGANYNVAKLSTDNNNSRANGLVSNNNGSNASVADKDSFPSPGFGKPVPSCKPFPASSDQLSKEVARTDSEKDLRESGQGDAKRGDDCSNEERDGPVRLSYAQVAQTKKDGMTGVPSATSQASVSAVSSNSVGSTTNTNSALAAHSASTSMEDKKKPCAKDTKDARNLPKSQRGSGDRDSRFRRGGFRHRMMSDHSDGGPGSSGELPRRLPKPSRDPK